MSTKELTDLACSLMTQAGACCTRCAPPLLRSLFALCPVQQRRQLAPHPAAAAIMHGARHTFGTSPKGPSARVTTSTCLQTHLSLPPLAGAPVIPTTSLSCAAPHHMRERGVNPLCDASTAHCRTSVCACIRAHCLLTVPSPAIAVAPPPPPCTFVGVGACREPCGVRCAVRGGRV